MESSESLESLDEAAIECNQIESSGLLRQEVKKPEDLMRIAEDIRKPILTHDHKEYWMIDGNCVFIFRKQ